MVSIELVNEKNEKELLKINRGEIPFEYVESVEYTLMLHHVGQEKALEGMCLAIQYQKEYVGIILIGEAILEDYEPVEVRDRKPFRVIGFVIDANYRRMGIGSKAFEMILDRFYEVYGNRPLLLECHEKNLSAIAFYKKFGFVRTGIRVGNDCIMVKMDRSVSAHHC